MEEVSVVIPTRNRAESLLRLLKDLSRQTYPLKEVIIVDSSDEPLGEGYLEQQSPSLDITYLVSQPSVCVQRNIGIRQAKAPYVFLCDDDIELMPNYVETLIEYLGGISAPVVSGTILQKDESGQWVDQYPPKSFLGLLFSFIFQRSIWGDVNSLKVNRLVKPLYKSICRFYRSRDNTLSFAGWPVITNFSKPVFRADSYGLGASIVKKESLPDQPFDEVLDDHGIGDNYGLAMSFATSRAIHVLTDTHVYHHQSKENRLDDSTSYYYRLLALHYFLKKSKRFGVTNHLWFIWSLFGNMIFNNKQVRKASQKVLKLMITGKNPYLIASKKGNKCIQPEF